MEIPAHNPVRRPRRVLACLALLVSLLACAALSAAAFGRTAHDAHSSHGGRRPACAGHRAKHGTAKHCAKHHGQKTHKAKKPAAKPSAPAPKLVPALCEDGSAPVRSASGSFTCEDGSEPACEDGSETIHPSSSAAPMCHVQREETEPACEPNGECNVEFACEDAEEATTGPQGCEHGSAFEEEEIEA
jgi:hypothetical protein